MRTWLYAVMVVLYLIVKVGQVTALTPLLSGLALVAIAVSLLACSWITRGLAALFLGAGSWLLMHAGVAWHEYLGAYGEMLYLLALFIVVPLLSVPVRLGGYDKAIETILTGRVTSLFSFNCVVTGLAFICGSFMSMAAVPVMMASMGAVVNRYPIPDRVRFMAVSTTYGYVLPVLWTPVSGVAGIVLDALKVEWIDLFSKLFLVSVAGLLVNWIIFYFLEVRGKPPCRAAEAAPHDTGTASPVARLLQMICAIVLLIGSIALLEQWLRIGLVTVVTLISIPYAILWCIVIGKGRPSLRETGSQLVLRLPAMADQFAIFLSAGFFARALQISGADQTVNLLFLQFRDLVGTQALLLLMPLMALTTSFLGMHPLVVIALLGNSLKPEILGVSALQLAIALVGSSVLTYMLGPFSGTLGLVQSINRVSTFRLSLWNAPYAFGYFVLLAIAIMLA